MSEPDTPPFDVEALMEGLRRRVADKKAQGLYTVDAVAADAVHSAEPFGLDQLERLRELAVQNVDLSVAASDKPVLGPAVSTVKRALVRGTSQPLYAAASRSNEFNAALLAYLAALAREVAALRAAVETADAEGGWQAAGASGDPARLARAGEEAVAQAERAETYREVLGETPVLVVGAGTGAVLDALPAGSRGFEPDAALGEEALRQGRPVTVGDAAALLQAEPERSVTGVLVLDLVERLDGAGVTALAAALRHACAPGARVVVEGIDPRTPEGAERLWADAGRLRGLSPEAVAGALGAAGLRDAGRLEADLGPGTYAVHALG